MKTGTRWLRGDFHLHTLDDPRDPHVRHTAFELLDRAAEKGFEVLAFTLHGRQMEDAEIAAYAESRGILLLRGVEQDIEGRHVLLLNFPKRLAESLQTFSDLARLSPAEREGRLIVAAHPFYPGKICLGSKVLEEPSLFDAIEVTSFYNSFWNPNRRAREAAALLGKPLLGNSDTHTLEQFGLTYWEAEAEKTPEGVIRSIKAGRVRVVSRPMSLFETALVGMKVVGYGYLPWIDYKKSRNYRPRA